MFFFFQADVIEGFVNVIKQIVVVVVVFVLGERISNLSRFRTNSGTFAGHCLETGLDAGH